MQKRYGTIGLLLLCILLAGILAAVGVAHLAQARSHARETSMLASLWDSYKRTSWDANSGRTIDHQSQDASTSEGQSYTMLRAVWMNDASAFNKTWQWSRQNLQRPDKLFAWQWGKRSDGSWGVLSASGGNNTASDADSDTALALLLAYGRWHTASYLDAAKQIVPAIWNAEVLDIHGRYYLLADNLEKASATPLINPSYYAPYAYRQFAGIDTAHAWNALASQSYSLLHDASQQKLDSSSSANLPPDWVQLNTPSGQLAAANGHDSNFGYDAIRSVWRTALDYEWTGDADAKNTLASFSRLADFWNHDGRLYAVYNHSGQPVQSYQSIATYGATLGYYQVVQPRLSRAIYTSKLASLFTTGGQLKQPLSYYDNNWAWFGLALYSHSLTKPSPGGTLG